MITIAALPSSLPWLVVTAIMAVVAGIGGLLVFWGLWIEGAPNEEYFRDINEFRRHKVKAKRGWNILMAGIFVEIVVAVAFAAREGWQARQTAIEIARNDPLNQSVSDVSAIVLIQVKGGVFDETDAKTWSHGGVPWVAYMLLLDSNNKQTSFGSGMLVADNFSRMFWGTNFGENRAYNMRFHLEDMGMVGDDKKARDINQICALNINAIFLPTNAVILGGDVTLLVNSEIRRVFKIPPQTNTNPEDNPFFSTGHGIMLFATNSTQPTAVTKAQK